MSMNFRSALAVLPFLLAVACTDAAKAPAEAAMAAAAGAVQSLQGDAAKFAPDAVKGVQDAYGSAKDLIAKQDYKGALAVASEIPARAKSVLDAVAAKKAELTKYLADFTNGFPQVIEGIKARIAQLSSAKTLPAGLDKAALAKASEGTAALEAGYQKLVAEAKGLDTATATAKGKELVAQANQILKSLNRP
jgi:hypothetical protein